MSEQDWKARAHKALECLNHFSGGLNYETAARAAAAALREAYEAGKHAGARDAVLVGSAARAATHGGYEVGEPEEASLGSRREIEAALTDAISGLCVGSHSQANRRISAAICDAIEALSRPDGR
jgi:hypothetical protein